MLVIILFSSGRFLTLLRILSRYRIHLMSYDIRRILLMRDTNKSTLRFASLSITREVPDASKSLSPSEWLYRSKD